MSSFNTRGDSVAYQDTFFDKGPTNLSLEKPTITPDKLDNIQD